MSNELAVQQGAAMDKYDFLDRDEVEEDAPTGQTNPEDGHLHGFVYGMPYEEYAAVDALNGSTIVEMRKSPMKYKHNRENPKPTTPALFLGTLMHRMILEPHLDNEIAVWGVEEEQKTRRGGVWEAFRIANEGKIILTIPEFNSVEGVAVGVLNNEPIRQYAHAEGPTEVCMFWRDPLSGRRMKARLDKLIPSTDTIFDLKSTRDCQSFKFGAQSYALGYHIKAALYMEGYQTLTGLLPKFRIGAIEKVAPFESVTFRITPDVFAQGWDELHSLIRKIEECEKSGDWPAEHPEETDLLLPAWTQYSDDSEVYNDV